MRMQEVHAPGSRGVSTGATAPSDEGGRWSADVCGSGDLTFAEASRGDVLVVVITDSKDSSPDPLHARLREVLDDAYGVEDSAPGRAPIPPVLQRVVRSLVEWSEEHGQDGSTAKMWSLALLHSTTAPVVAHIGGAEPRLETEVGSLTPRTLLLRGDAGGQARALCLRPGRFPAVTLTWSTGEEPSGSHTIERRR